MSMSFLLRLVSALVMFALYFSHYMKGQRSAVNALPHACRRLPGWRHIAKYNLAMCCYVIKRTLELIPDIPGSDQFCIPPWSEF